MDPKDKDIRLKIAQSVVDLHVARRTLLIYPITHEQVKKSIVKAFKCLSGVLVHLNRATLAVMKGGIRYDNENLSGKNSAIKDFAAVLKHYQIATVTFQKGLEIKELARFLQLICTDSDKIVARGGIDAVSRECHFATIQVQAVDYKRLQLTEEQEIHRGTASEDGRGSIWQEFVSGVMSNQGQSADPADSPISPEYLAEMINQQKLDAAVVVDHYQSMFFDEADSATTESASPKELAVFQQLIKELNPHIKKQFLSATFDKWGADISMSDAARLIDSFGGDLIIEMIRQANAQNKEISPSLLAFVGKMGHWEAILEDLTKGEGKGDRPRRLSAQKVEALLAREKYDTYVDDHYGTLLDKLTHDALTAGRSSGNQRLVREIETGLTDGVIAAHAGRAIMRLMRQSENSSVYRDWARQLTFLLDDLLDVHAYGYLTRLIRQVRREKTHENKDRADIAGLVLDRFSEPQFVAKAIESLETLTEDTGQETLAFFMEIGEPVVVEIFDGLDPDQTFNELGMLPQILQNLARLTVKEALIRSKDPNPGYVRRMIRIVRKMGDNDSAEQIRPLMDHSDAAVRMEALATLLKFENKWGSVRLSELLSDPMGESYTSAMDIAGRYGVRSAVPQLQAIALQRGEQHAREASVRALGRIGDPQSIATLRKLVRRRWGITQKYNRHLRKVVFESLEGYPAKAVKDLLHYGLKQKDEAIQAVSRRLLRKGGQSAIQDPA